MQMDMHYYGVYAMARAAGMRAGPAEIVATASEYVDDAIWDREVLAEDGRCILTEMTAHKLLDYNPDRPYLRWRYVRAVDGKEVERDNPKDYLAACKAMHEMFKAYLERMPKKGESGTGKRWKEIRNPVKKLIEIEGDKDTRIKAWKKAMRNNQLFGGNAKVPQYKGHKWSASIDDLEPLEIPKNIDKLPVYRFYQAVRIYRAHVLSNLLPSSNIIAA